ncbi:MAG: DnaB-like helicase C-terminal domain-containing protein, partial [Bosea sp. (in: a-proteobacteria)]
KGDWTAVTQAIAKLRLPIHICDQPVMSLPSISSEARRLHAKSKLSLLVVDYLGLIDLPKADRNDISVGFVTRGMKQLARQLEIPVVLLCQLSRKCEERSNKRPMMSDLRDAGQIEQDADTIIFLYRDKYYAELEGRKSDFGDVAEINVAKQRHGPPGVVPAVFRGEQITFADYFGDWPLTVNAATHKGFKPS